MKRLKALEDKIPRLLEDIANLTNEDLSSIDVNNIKFVDGKEREFEREIKEFQNHADLLGTSVTKYQRILAKGKSIIKYYFFKVLAGAIAEKDDTCTVYKKINDADIVHELVHLIDSKKFKIHDKLDNICGQLETLENSMYLGIDPTTFGYSSPEGILKLKSQVKIKHEERLSLKSIIEGHAMYIENRWREQNNLPKRIKNISPEGISKIRKIIKLCEESVTYKEFIDRSKAIAKEYNRDDNVSKKKKFAYFLNPLPYFLPRILFLCRKPVAFLLKERLYVYSAGQTFISEAYKRQISIGQLYNNPPTKEEFINPKSYFERENIKEQ